MTGFTGVPRNQRMMSLVTPPNCGVYRFIPMPNSKTQRFPYFLHVKSTPKHQKYIDEIVSLIEDL